MDSIPSFLYDIKVFGHSGSLISLITIIICAIVSAKSGKDSSNYSNFITYIKLVLIAFVVIAGFTKFKIQNFDHLFNPENGFSGVI